jgi:hypothetical protein
MLACQGVKVTACALFAVYFLPLTCEAAFKVRNVTPFAQGVGIPELKQGRLLQQGGQGFEAQLLWTNQFYEGENEAQDLLIDVESWQLDLAYQYRFEYFQLGLEVPLIRYGGGTMDNFVEWWHEVFNLPNGSRENYKADQINIYYEHDGERYEQSESYEGIGDIRLSAAFQLFANEAQAHALYVLAKLPTANNIWLSSGGTDVGLAISHQFDSGRWQRHLQYSASYLGEGDWLEEERESLLFTLHAALGYFYTEKLLLQVQLDGNSALFDQALEKPMGKGAIITTGFEYHATNGVYKLALVEDIRPDTGPDVGFLFGFATEF